MMQISQKLLTAILNNSIKLELEIRSIYFYRINFLWIPIIYTFRL